MHYRISFDQATTHYLTIALSFTTSVEHPVLYLPAWRPGRYQIQNFAKRIKNVRAFQSDSPIEVRKTSKDSWQLRSEPVADGSPCIYKVVYQYFAFAMDAGNSWLDDEQLYLNFINCALYTEEGLTQRQQVDLVLPDNYKVATGLEHLGKHTFEAPSYYQLVDSPLMASSSLRQISYRSRGSEFHLWIQGELPKTDESVIEDFQAFTDLQIDVMGEFPCEEYHFMFQCLPYKHYHGVEHWNSTMITIGPAEQLKERPLYKEFLGVSSHELFHTWNVIRLRPREMTPYDFQRENYHETGFVTEGVTTYYGDLFLGRSGVFSHEEYLSELNKLLQRHYDNPGRLNYSVADSSYDLWLDGYERGIPGRKVSIYNEGALAALILDLKIRQKYEHKKSLDDVMRLMWERHGKDRSGYTYDDYQQAAETVFGESLSEYFEEIVSGTRPYEDYLAPLIKWLGLSFDVSYPDSPEQHSYGIKIAKGRDHYVVDRLAPGTNAEGLLSEQDIVLKINGKDFKGEWPEDGKVILDINRFGRNLTVEVEPENEGQFGIYQVSIAEAVEFRKWLGS